MLASCLKKRSAVGGVCLIVVGGALCLAGCEAKSTRPPVVITPPPASSQAVGYTSFSWSSDELPPRPGPVPGIDHASLVLGKMGDGAAYVVWTDLYNASGGGGAGGGRGSAPPNHDAVSYHAHLYRDTTRIEVKCKTPDGKTGTLELNGEKLELADGSLILVSTTGPKIRWKQLQRDTLQMPPERETFEELAKTDPEIKDFFSPPGEVEKQE